MKSLMLLLRHVLQDCETYCGTTTTRDFLTISRRVEHEGLSFLTITLGDYASDFERSLEIGTIDPAFFRSFSKNGSIPKLFSGMIGQVFDNDGKLLDEPSIAAIFCVRQVCRMFKKILLPCSKERDLAAVEEYIKVERDLSMLKLAEIDSQFLLTFKFVSGLLWSSVLGPLSKSIEDRSTIPRHGTGATATKVLQNQKYSWTQWHQRLETYFPSDQYCYHSFTAFMEESSKIDYVSPECEQPVRVVFVPKTLKTPRVIGIEPACMQYTQQALMSQIVKLIEKHPLTKGHVNFSSQAINAELAILSSKEGHLASIDMKEASDRVHHALVELMLDSVPIVRDAIFACRSTKATLPNGLTLPLQKFASMGSALCFPIESMVFYTILITAEIIRLNLRRSASSVEFVRQNMFVYGDDLFCPVALVPHIAPIFSAVCLKMNSNKSFCSGRFRESCGMDAYDGVDVTTIYVRRLLPSSVRDVSGLVSTVALSNQLHKKGFFRSAEYLEDYLSRKRINIPVVVENSACVGYIRPERALTIHRRNKKLHRPEVKGFVVVAKKQLDIIDGNLALMKHFLDKHGVKESLLHPRAESKEAFTRSVGSGRLTVKRQWSSVY